MAYESKTGILDCTRGFLKHIPNRRLSRQGLVPGNF